MLPKSPRRRARVILDRVWEAHTSPLFEAAIELFVAARTDPELRVSLSVVEQDVAQAVAAVGPGLFPEIAFRETFRTDVETTIAAIRGMALLRFVDDPAEIDRRWLAVKGRAVEVLLGEDEGVPAPSPRGRSG